MGINENIEQSNWTDSPKPYCNLYIDDSGLGCPTLFDSKVSDRPFVDWTKVKEILIEKGYLKK